MPPICKLHVAIHSTGLGLEGPWVLHPLSLESMYVLSGYLDFLDPEVHFAQFLELPFCKGQKLKVP